MRQKVASAVFTVCFQFTVKTVVVEDEEGKKKRRLRKQDISGKGNTTVPNLRQHYTCPD